MSSPALPPSPASLPPSAGGDSNVLPQEEDAVGGGISLDLVLRLLLRHGFWIILFMLIGPALASLWLNRQVRWYQASTTIVYDWSQPATLGHRVDVFDPYADYFSKQELMETEFHIITSQRVLR